MCDLFLKKINQKDLNAKAQFVSSILRGGHVTPGDSIYLASLHAFALFQYIIQREKTQQVLLGSFNPQSTFVTISLKLIGSDMAYPFC